MANNEIEINKRTVKRVGILAAFLVIVGIAVVLLIVVQVPYTGYAVYTEQDPYTKQQCDDVALKSVVEWGTINSVCENEICDQTESRCVDTNWYGGCEKYQDYCIHEACTKYRRYCNLKIENIDDEGGVWTIEGYSWNYDTKSYGSFVENLDIYVEPHRIGGISWDYLYDAGENMGCNYHLKNTPTKKVCDNVIDYRSIEKTKEEIRYCNAWKKIAGKC